jgi:NitT/TauT family transport system permease protein
MSLIRTYVKIRRTFSIIDVAVFIVLSALMYGLIAVGKEWEGVLRPTVEIDLSPWSLPKYTFFSLVRGFTAYAISLIFTLIYGYVAAYHRKAEKIMIPLLDILQSIPVLGFLPSLIIAFVAIFPHSNVGLELAAIIMIFTGQVWNMTFSYYNSLKAIPNDLREAGRVYRLSWWKRFTKLELPYSSIGLVWNSMMSMAGGWFFLTINEAFVLGNKDFRLPGIGSYMSVAIMEGNLPAMINAIIAMTLMIVIVDQIFWRPIVAWTQKFKFEETESADVTRSFVLDMLSRSHVLKFTRTKLWHPAYAFVSIHLMDGIAAIENREPAAVKKYLRTTFVWLFNGIFLGLVIVGVWKLFGLLSGVSLAKWGMIIYHLLFTFSRVLAAITIGTIVMIPLGVTIGLNPKLSRILQPVIQVVASFPAPMLFPLVILGLAKLGVGINYAAVALMLLGTQWYILFNVVAGAMAIPHDLREVSKVMNLSRVQTWTRLILPGIFPSLITGWVTSAGGAWNASIVAEYVHFGNRILIADGLGSTITQATDSGDFGLLTASVLAMTFTVVSVNRLFWKKLYRLAEERYSLNK